MMQNKVRQITDSVHGTIYISELEHQMMSTPFFYRLHDVYQSSTVYMTFPSNRTKRYEHSLGTMELAGQLFYSAVTNASNEDQKRFLSELQAQFEAILEILEDRSKLSNVRIYQAEANRLGRLIPKSGCNMTSFMKLLEDTAKSAPLSDRALCKQEVCFFDLLEQDNGKAMQKIPVYTFLYQCALEALRIAALFHDIGHPPFSHIIEFTLQKLYGKETAGYDANKLAEFKQCLEKFMECKAVEPILLDQVNGNSRIKDPALHEQIGLHILYNAYRGVLNQQVAEWGKSQRDKANRLRAVYLVTVIEFTFGILLEKAPIFSSLHRMIDGPVDVDRLDYIVRDSRNTGVDWGTIPYNRLVSTAKFAYKSGTLRIAFPEKVCEDIDDLLVNRYKIFQRINYHHKSIKTSELMQRSVEMLAEDYLISQPGSEIMPEIKNLWCSLGAAFGQEEVENQISQWTDSWLVSVLSNTLIKLSDSDVRSDLIDDAIGRTEDKLDKLYRMLEEVQLNRKRYFTLLKRHRDALLLRDKIIEKAGITEDALTKLSNHEYDKLVEASGESADSALEALHRISVLKNEILHVANFGLLDTFFPGEKTCKELIENVLKQAQIDGKIQDYFLWTNTGFKKLGVSETTEIFLYRRGSDVYQYDITTSLLPKLKAQRASCLWLYGYVCLSDIPEKQADELIDSLFDKIALAIGESIHKVMNDLFDFDSVVS